ncbi:hypothetical protein FEP90_02550 [Burkholderia multivorans]|nr:hypothetical protein [Burkholderia multivorans]MDR8764989.1 hypothetical protein [Burkholderia multivorans]MDR8773022.1 hypothetical protein [Burkholderia multivorans]MDR8790554.1 hypothetical protein [Burkholderia multivorans]MDR8797500.1 hypothetical protein [Burkholderia multivorans]
MNRVLTCFGQRGNLRLLSGYFPFQSTTCLSPIKAGSQLSLEYRVFLEQPVPHTLQLGST